MDTAEAALPEDDRALHSRRPGSDDEHVVVCVRSRLELLRMPAAAVFLAGGRVLGAADVVAPLGLHDADVAPDALADLPVAALLDLLREERVGDGRAGRADEVPGPAPHDLRHAVRARQAPDTDDRLRGHLAHPAGPLQLVALGEETGGAGILRPVRDRADVHVPQVDEVVGEDDEARTFVELDSGGPERLDAEANGDRAVVSHRRADLLQRLDPEARAVLERAPVGVGALVVEGREELQRQIAVAAVDVDDVETGVPGELRRAHPLLADSLDVAQLHRLRDDERVVVARELGGPERRAARLAAVRVHAAVRQLDAGERAVLVGLVAHEREVAHVVLVPDPGRDDGPVIGVARDQRLFGVHRRPAALRLHPAEARLRARLLRPEPRAVRHLVEAVPQCLRPDPDGLEEDVVLRVAGHTLQIIPGVGQPIQARREREHVQGSEQA